MPPSCRRMLLIPVMWAHNDEFNALSPHNPFTNFSIEINHYSGVRSCTSIEPNSNKAWTAASEITAISPPKNSFKSEYRPPLMTSAFVHFEDSIPECTFRTLNAIRTDISGISGEWTIHGRALSYHTAGGFLPSIEARLGATQTWTLKWLASLEDSKVTSRWGWLDWQKWRSSGFWNAGWTGARFAFCAAVRYPANFWGAFSGVLIISLLTITELSIECQLFSIVYRV